MDFTLSEQQVALQQSVRKFAQQELPAIAKQIDRRGQHDDQSGNRYKGVKKSRSFGCCHFYSRADDGFIIPDDLLQRAIVDGENRFQ
jgi:hypothetical protein